MRIFGCKGGVVCGGVREGGGGMLRSAVIIPLLKRELIFIDT